MNKPPRSSSSSPSPAASRERRIRLHAFWYVVTAIIISLVMAAILMRSWTMFWIGLALGIAYALLLMMPVFLANVSGDDEKSNKS